MGLSLSSIDLRSKLVESGIGEQCPYEVTEPFFIPAEQRGFDPKPHLGSLLSSVESIFIGTGKRRQDD